MRHGLLVACLTGLAVSTVTATAQAQGEFGARRLEQRIYDRTGALSAREAERLEADASEVQRLGADVVVYIQSRAASDSDTEDDAKRLMDSWHLETRPGAADGLVFMINVKPDDRIHGSAAIYAGARLISDQLPDRELRAILDDRMHPLLADGRLADGLGAGLEATSQSLEGHAIAVSRIAGFIRGPLNIWATAVALAVLALALLTWWRNRSRRQVGTLTVSPPDNLSPALAGALTTGRVRPQLIDAALLSLGRRGAVAIEPVRRQELAVRLQDERGLGDGFDRRLWERLATLADDKLRVSSADVFLARSGTPLLRMLRRELHERGWFVATPVESPGFSIRAWVHENVPAGARLLAAGAAVSAGLAAACLAGTLIAPEPSGFWAVAVLTVSAWVGLRVALSSPGTTAEGEAIAAKWRGYATGIRHAIRRGDPIDLDEAVVRLMAMDRRRLLHKRMQQADAAGVVPAWLSGHSNVAIGFGYIDSWPDSSSGNIYGTASGSQGVSSDGGGASGSF